MSEILCPQCATPNRSTAHFCEGCGAPLSRDNSPAGEMPGGASEQPDAVAGGTSEAVDQPTRIETQQGKTLLGRYRIEGELGRGGFGAVYKAWDINLERPCAVKENLNTSANAQRQFAREATVLANLSHPNLPRVTDHFSIPDQGQYLVMDFVAGDDLSSLLRRQKTLPIERCLDWMIQVAGALVYLHSRQPAVLHRDIKPANIRLTPDGTAMLVDFGLVKMADPTLKTTLGARALTPGYAPPEQYGLGRTDARSDLYALGATLYKLLTHHEPLESVQRITGAELAPARKLNPLIPPRLEKVIEKALELDPARRYQGAAEMKADLQACLPPPTPVVVAPRAPAVSLLAARSEASLQPVVSGQALPAGDAAAEAQPEPLAPRLPWLWIGLGAAVVLTILCFTLGGGTLAWLGLRGTTPTPGVTAQALASPVGINPPSLKTTPSTASPASASPAPLPLIASMDPTTYVQVDTGQPDTLDPALDYETSGLQVIANLYDTLVFYQRQEPTVLIPQLALEVPSQENGGISPDGLVYTFKIRPGVTFHDGSLLTAGDVAYSFQRNILQGGSSSPMRLLTEPVFGVGVYDVAELVDPDLVDNPDALAQADAAKLLDVCRRLQEAIRADQASGTLTFRLAQPWAPFLSTLAGGWGSIRSQAWTVANGGWDGDCATWQKYYGRTAAQLNETPLGSGGMGTGPYRLESWTKDDQIVLKANENYWRREPAWPDGPAGAPALKTVIIRYQPAFPERLAALENGEADSIHLVSNAEWPELDRLTGAICDLSDQDCQPSANPNGPLELIRGFPVASRDYDIFLNWSINQQGGNDLIGSGSLDGAGIPPDFFSNLHVRRAFQFCFNYEAYFQEVMQGEGERSFTVMIPGMPGSDADAPHFVYDPQRCQEEFRQAGFGGSNVWQTGFTLMLPYPQGGLPIQKITENFERELTAINPLFKVESAALVPDDYWQRYAEDRLPLYTGSWIEDIHDPHNWVVPYTVVHFGSQLNLPSDLTRRFQDIIDHGVAEQDPVRREAIYREFNTLFYEQAPVLLLYQSLGRRYQQRWVHGWYNNPLYPGLYFYALGKD
jgi:peptide/nickel transport system substrate-binding protein